MIRIIKINFRIIQYSIFNIEIFNILELRNFINKKIFPKQKKLSNI